MAEMKPVNNSVASFQSTGRGTVVLGGKEYDVFTVTNDIKRDRDNDGLKGNIVEIDGKQYKVVGVESYVIPFIRKGDSIGLAVEVV